MRGIDDIPIWGKALAASVVLLLCLVGVGVNAYVTLERSASSLTALSQINLRKQRTISELTHDINTAHEQIFRYVLRTGNAASADALTSYGIVASLDLLKERLRGLLSEQNLSPTEESCIRDVLADWTRYQAAAKYTASLVATDPALALKILDTTDQNFQDMAIKVQILTAYLSNQTRLLSNDITASAASNKRLLAIAGLLGALASILIMLLVGRSIIRPIRAVTDAMKQVCSDTPDVELGNRERKDEIGEMVRSIDVFRQHLEQQNQLLKQREEELRVKNLRFDTAINNMSHGLSMFDADQRLVVCNDRYVQMYGLPAELAKPGTALLEIFQHRAAASFTATTTPQAYYSDLVPALKDKSAWTKIRELKDGRTISVVYQPMTDGGWVSTHEDITERRRSEEQIAHLAHYDALTDLPNRILLRERLEQALAAARRGDGAVAVLMLDLDRFKEINDTLGHPAGDALLKAAGDRLRHCVRGADTVARLGGDEFAIVAHIEQTAAEAAMLAKRIEEAMAAPFELQGNQVSIGTSIGIAMVPGDGDDPDELLKNADLALYRAKGEGRGTHKFFELEMNDSVQARRNLEQDLRQALVRAEFELHYQPRLNLERNEICGFEALLRWQHPRRGLLAPGEFIPLAEETGLIVEIGDWVLRKACQEAATWPEPIIVSVNISAAQLRCRTLGQSIMGALAAAQLPPDRLELEVTESVALQDDESVLTVLGQLREVGVRIALDDFGPGYSSLSFLRKFPFDTIKIDRCFIADSETADSSLAILRAITSLASHLGMATTAEGVETKEQLDRAGAEGCTEMQGYYFSHPLRACDLLGLLKHPLQIETAA